MVKSENMDGSPKYTEADVGRTREQFPKIGGESSHAHSAPGASGDIETSGVVVSARVGGKDQTFKFPPEEYSDVENDKDRRVLETAFSELKKNSQPISDARKQVLADLVASFEGPGESFLGQAQKFLGRKAEAIARTGDSEAHVEQARGNLAGWLGERLNLMFGLGSENVKTVFGSGALNRIRVSTSLVETADLLLTKDSSIVAAFMTAEKGLIPGQPQGRIFQREVAKANYPPERIKQAIAFDYSSGRYTANPEVVFARSEFVLKTLARLNNTERPDALILARTREEVTGKLMPDPESVLGPVESKAYYPWEVKEMLELMTRSGWGVLGGESGGQHLAVDIGGQLDYITELSQNGFPNRDEAIVVVRFPADAPLEVLQQLGQLALEHRIKNLVIQTLPYTRAELDTLIEATLDKVNLKEIIAQAPEKKK